MSALNSTARRGRALTALLLVIALAATACAGGDAEPPAADLAAEGPSDTDATPSEDAEPEEEPASNGSITPGTDTFGVEVDAELDVKPEVTLPGGDPPDELVIVDVVEGDGDVIEAGATVTTHYVGVSWLNEGEQFDSSWDRGQPATFSLSGVIPGWTDGIPGMRVGGRRLLIIPPEQAYGATPPPGAPIAPNDTLVFVIDMVPPPEPIVPGTDPMGVEVSGEPGTKPEISLPGGEPPTELVVVDLIEGDGPEVPFGASVTTHYVGVSWTNDGAEFDSSWDRGEPATFPLSGVISGWTEGIPGMRAGGRRLLIIPPDQAYGEPGRPPTIAPNDTLVFVLDLVGSS